MSVYTKLSNIIKPLLIVICYWFFGGVFVQVTGTSPLVGTCILNMIIIALYVIYKRRYNVVKIVALRTVEQESIPRYLSLALVLFINIWLFGQITGSWFYENMGSASYDAYQTSIGSDAFVAAMLTLILAPMAEEILIRQVLYLKWRNSVGVWFAIFAQALVFAIIHGTSVHFVGTFMFAMVQVLILEVTGHLRYCMLSHTAYNTMSLLLGGITIPNALGLPVVFGIVDVLLIVSVILLLIDIFRKDDKYGEKEAYN